MPAPASRTVGLITAIDIAPSLRGFASSDAQSAMLFNTLGAPLMPTRIMMPDQPVRLIAASSVLIFNAQKARCVTYPEQRAGVTYPASLFDMAINEYLMPVLTFRPSYAISLDSCFPSK